MSKRGVTSRDYSTFSLVISPREVDQPILCLSGQPISNCYLHETHSRAAPDKSRDTFRNIRAIHLWLYSYLPLPSLGTSAEHHTPYFIGDDHAAALGGGHDSPNNVFDESKA